MFWIYWILIVVAIIVLAILACYYAPVRNYLGMVLGRFLSNNNWRWGALGILAVIITISALLAGFGQPILASTAKEVKASVSEKLDNHPAAVGEIRKLLWGTNSAPSVLSSTRVIEKSYSSWWHWKIAILLWSAWLVYTPFAFRDEAMHAIKTALKAVERRKRLNSIRASSAASAIKPPAQTEPGVSASGQSSGVITKANLWKQIFQAEVVMEFLEIFGKLILRKAAGLFK